MLYNIIGPDNLNQSLEIKFMIKLIIYIYLLYREKIRNSKYKQMHSTRINQTTPNSSPRKQPAPVGFPYPADDEQDTLHLIWQSFKETKLAIPSEGIIECRSKTVYLMMQCHKLLKLPIQTLYLSVSIFDKFLNKNYLKDCQENSEIFGLGIACLYSCQKLEKIRNYGVSHWLKNISPQFLSSIGFFNINLTSQSIKKFEAKIMQTMNYNLFCNTPFDILLGTWTLKPPTEQQFYFSQYFLEISLLSSFHEIFEQNCLKQLTLLNSNTATSITQKLDINENEDNENYINTLELVFAVSMLSKYFVNADPQQIDWLVKKLWDLGAEENSKKFQTIMYRIHLIANKIFQKALVVNKDPNCKTIYLKYGKQVNLSISHYKFVNKSPEAVKNENSKNSREQLHTSGSSIYKSI